ncbi:MAG: AtpZ/AtpI family protein [Saprospiraceae bacterium]|nr:AtpZ/AtpI family protein [Saprospiraceae bacterium]
MIGKKNEESPKTNAYLKYSGLAFQMAFVVLAAIFLGKKLDIYLGFQKPFSTIFLVLLFFSLFMYKLYKELNNQK